MKHLKQNDYVVTPWRNGQGSTAQIAIHPLNSSFKDGSFDWRLSTAEVSGSGDFSSFHGFERLLIVWQGSGVFLNEELLPAFTTHRFKGEEEIYCELIHEKVKDLGLIFRPEKVKANFRLIEMSEVLTLNSGEYFIFCGEGISNVDQYSLTAGECLRVAGPTQVEIKKQLEPLKLILVSIFQLS